MLAQYYQTIYLIVVAILTVFVMQNYKQQELGVTSREGGQWGTALILTVIVVFFIGLRPNDEKYFFDIDAYSFRYYLLEGEPYVFDKNATNLFFDNWFAWMASYSVGLRTILIIFASVYFGFIYIAVSKLFPRDVLLAFLVYLAAFSTFSYGTNGMKAGMAASTFLIALAFRDKLWLSIPIALFTYFQHHSMALVIAAYALTLLVKDSKYYFAGWLFCLAMAALHISYFQFLFAGFTDEHGAEYLLTSRNSGFRIDFILYSVVPIWIGFLMKYKYKIESKMYTSLLNLYLCTNGLWLLCMYSDFTNRISYLSWFIYPIVLLYPFVNLEWSSRQPRYLRYVVYGHLAFTLFMMFVYYA